MKRFLVILSAVLCFNAMAYVLTLTPAEQAKCDAGGGCDIMTFAQLRAALQMAFDAGAKTCEVRL